MREELYDEMFEMEQRHWWFAAKHQIVSSLLRRYLPRVENGSRPRIADLGCGCGMLLSKLRDAYDVRGMDASPQAIEFCARRGVTVEKGGLPEDVPLERGAFDAVLLLDVLEHLGDDRSSAVAAAQLLRPGGILFCTVPAYPWLWSPRDEHHHHKRRYTAAAFRKLFEDQRELRLELFSHYNSWLFPVAAAARVASKFTPPRDAGGTDLSVPPAPLNTLLRHTFASERHLLGRVRLPAGLSLIAIARKTS
jgi:2-polyprenyl-3-methyl-5-hydroxy-6-metoxy-1,4-benzoquinol methylase